jgi:histone H2A
MTKARVASRVGATAPVFVAAILQYITSEVLEKGMAELAKGKKRITPRVVSLGIRGDDELDQVFSKVTIAAGGVQPDNIHVSLLGKKAQKAAAAADDGGYYYY